MIFSAPPIIPSRPIIRSLEESDAPDWRNLIQALSEEGPYLVRSPGEHLPGSDEVRRQLARERQGAGQTLVAELPAGLVGYASLTRSPWRRRSHVAHLVIGVRQPWQGQGVGGDLLDALLRWAATANLRRIELTVTASNRRAIILYRRRGFLEEGRKIGSVQGNMGDEDELLMAKSVGMPISRQAPDGTP